MVSLMCMAFDIEVNQVPIPSSLRSKIQQANQQRKRRGSGKGKRGKNKQNWVGQRTEQVSLVC